MKYRHDPMNGVYLCRHHHEMAETKQAEFMAVLKWAHPSIYEWAVVAARDAMINPMGHHELDLSTRLSSLRAMR